MSNISNSRHK